MQKKIVFFLACFLLYSNTNCMLVPFKEEGQTYEDDQEFQTNNYQYQQPIVYQPVEMPIHTETHDNLEVENQRTSRVKAACLAFVPLGCSTALLFIVLISLGLAYTHK